VALGELTNSTKKATTTNRKPLAPPQSPLTPCGVNPTGRLPLTFTPSLESHHEGPRATRGGATKQQGVLPQVTPNTPPFLRESFGGGAVLPERPSTRPFMVEIDFEAIMAECDVAIPETELPPLPEPPLTLFDGN